MTYPACIVVPLDSVSEYSVRPCPSIGFISFTRLRKTTSTPVCSEALIIFGIHEYTTLLVKFEYFMVISLVSSNFLQILNVKKYYRENLSSKV
jgi:hypothetical protein